MEEASFAGDAHEMLTERNRCLVYLVWIGREEKGGEG